MVMPGRESVALAACEEHFRSVRRDGREAVEDVITIPRGALLYDS